MSSKPPACKLTEQHGKIVDALRHDRPADNRRAVRYEHRVRAEIYPCIDGQLGGALTVQLEDFSHRGLSFHFKGTMLRGEQFVFRLPRADAEKTSVLCTVAYCRQSSEKEFRVGAEFTCIVRTEGAAVLTDKADVDRIKRSILS